MEGSASEDIDLDGQCGHNIQSHPKRMSSLLLKRWCWNSSSKSIRPILTHFVIVVLYRPKCLQRIHKLILQWSGARPNRPKGHEMSSTHFNYIYVNRGRPVLNAVEMGVK